MTGEDDLNKFRYRNKIVAFIDVLGMRKAILEDLVDERQTIARLDEAFTWSVNQIPLGDGDWYSLKLFSDCLCISCNPTRQNLFKLLREISYWHKIFFVYQRFLRGAITFGPHFESERIIFSKAMLEAYTLEKNVAIYPRVLISDSVLDILTGTNEEERRKIEAFIRVDSDGKYFVDYFNYIRAEKLNAHETHTFLIAHRDAIGFQVQHNESCAHVIEKYEWVGKYHNEARLRIVRRNDYSADEYRQLLSETEVNMDAFYTMPEGKRPGKPL